MQFEQAQSWRITEDEGWDLTVALFVRDLAGMRGLDETADPPGLRPEIDVDRELRDSIDRSTAWRSWNSWWSTLLRDRAVTRPGDDPRVRLRWAAPDVLFGGRQEEVWRKAFAWADRHKLDQFDRAGADHGRAGRLAMGRIAAAVVEPLGRPVRPFELAITTLPVAGVWSHRIDQHRVLVSQALRADPSSLERVVRPILHELV